MFEKSVIYLVGLHYGIYWVLWWVWLPFAPLNFISYGLDIVVTERITHKKFIHLQIGSCKCQYLEAFGPNNQWTQPLVTSWPSNIPHYQGCEVNRRVKSYLPE